MTATPDPASHDAPAAPDGVTAADLNRQFRESRPPPSDAGSAPVGGPGESDGALQSALAKHVQFILEHWGLSEPATIADWPVVGPGMSRLPLLGGLLAFAREVITSLWLKARRRSPISQQIALNQQSAIALKTIAWYLEDTAQIWSDLDRESQELRKNLGIVDDEMLKLRRNVGDLASRILALETELAALRQSKSDNERPHGSAPG